MTSIDLRSYRQRAALTQLELADRLGLSLRAIQDLEAGTTKLRDIHVLALDRASMVLALERRDPMLATEGARTDAMGLMHLMFPKLLVTDPGPSALR